MLRDDYGDDAEWRPTLKTHADYVAELRAQGPEVPHHICGVESLRRGSVCIGTKHTVLSGVASHVIANTLCEICDESMPGPNQNARMKELDKVLQKWYKDTKEQYRMPGHLEWNKLRQSGDWPCLVAQAAQTRHLSKFAEYLADEYNTGTQHDQLRLACTKLLVRFYSVLENEPRWMTKTGQTELRNISRTFQNVYNQLSIEALNNNLRRWKRIPKFHFFMHLCEHQNVLNPRATWVYADEDFQKLTKTAAKSLHPLTVDQNTLYKWVIDHFDVD